MLTRSADRVSTYSKMHRFAVQGDRSLILLTAGNLATSQAVVSQIQRDLEENAEFNISDAKYVSDIAEYIGQLNVAEQEKHRRPPVLLLLGNIELPDVLGDIRYVLGIRDVELGVFF